MEDGARSEQRRAVVTGIGPLTAIGIGREAFWRGLLAEQSGIRRLPAARSEIEVQSSELSETHATKPAVGGKRNTDKRATTDPLADSPLFHAKHAAWIHDFDPAAWFPPHRLKRLDRYVQFSIVAARLALEDAGLSLSAADPSPRVGVSFGTGLGGIAHAEAQHERFLQQGIRGVTPALAFQIWGGSAHSNIAIEFGLQGPATTNSNSCASGQVAVMDAARFVRDGLADVMIAGAAECPLAPLTFSAFDQIHTMSRWTGEPPSHAMRPFHRDRDGFVMGEGAAALVVESYEHASKRGARIYGEITGWSLTNEAHHMTTPRPDGAPLRAAIQQALAAARLRPDQIGHINAHGSSTPANDVHECQQLAEVFGNCIRRIPISGTKPHTGHTLGAAGAIEAVTCLLAMQNGWVPPTLHLTEPDPALAAFDLVPLHGREKEQEHVLSNSFGFGGVDSCLVISKV